MCGYVGMYRDRRRGVWLTVGRNGLLAGLWTVGVGLCGLLRWLAAGWAGRREEGVEGRAGQAWRGGKMASSADCGGASTGGGGGTHLLPIASLNICCVADSRRQSNCYRKCQHFVTLFTPHLWYNMCRRAATKRPHNQKGIAIMMTGFSPQQLAAAALASEIAKLVSLSQWMSREDANEAMKQVEVLREQQLRIETQIEMGS